MGHSHVTNLRAYLRPFNIHEASISRFTLAFILPFVALLLFPRRRSPGRQRSLRLLGLFGALILSAGFLTGCTSYTSGFVASTPAGTSQVTIKATSGSITQTTVINLTVQ
jgi:drug/metabolite transporter (DMT)-like permease